MTENKRDIALMPVWNSPVGPGPYPMERAEMMIIECEADIDELARVTPEFCEPSGHNRIKIFFANNSQPPTSIGFYEVGLIGRMGKTHLCRAKKYPTQVPVRITVIHRSNSTKAKTDLCFVGEPLRVRRVEAEIMWKLSTQYILLFSVRGFSVRTLDWLVLRRTN